MPQPWSLESTRTTPSGHYYDWIGGAYSKFDKDLCLCNWFPLRLLVEFAAASGYRLKLSYWPGQAPTDGRRRSWDTSQTLIHDSHSGRFATKLEYRRKVESTVTARMIGTLNTVQVEPSSARIGDLIVNDYSPSYWHVGIITAINGDQAITEAGSTPKVRPADHRATYKFPVSRTAHVYEAKPRRRNFAEICE